MTQIAIPFLLMRGGTSRGPYFLRSDLPENMDQLSKVLVAVVGAGNATNIDGLGGGNAVTTKVAMLSRSERDDADVDYFFAQVSVDEEMVDYAPTCGNMLVGVGPAAVEMGLVPIDCETTTVRIHAVNTGALVEAVVQTPGGEVNYEGDVAIAGVPGTAAPVALNFLDVVGSRCDGLLPTGKEREEIGGFEVSCVDVAMPMVIGRAEDFGISGYETADELNANEALFARMEKVRLEAGRRMGLGDVSKSVVPKFGLVSPARAGGHMSVRYFMPWKCHPSLAVTGSQCIAACALVKGSIMGGIAKPIAPSPAVVTIEHPLGEMDVTVTYDRSGDTLRFISAGLVRTARLISRGEVMVPKAALDVEEKAGETA
ncbi:4-oxalomesaconate tautomerase [Roseibium sp.]|uniref:4-oxalomesaconate tautomerase n=1 Tax=Roseibium sp. TaxID=1936156 RepID=UPI003A96EC4E